MLFDWFGSELTTIVIVLLSYIAVRLVQEHVQLARASRAAPQFEPRICSNVKSPELNEHTLCKQLSQKSSGLTILSRRSSETFSGDVESTLNSLENQEGALVDLIQDLSSKNYDAASALYFRGSERGMFTSTIPLSEMFLGLCSACIRVGSPHFVFKYFGEMDELGVARDLNFYNSVIKILTFKKHYKINLSINDTCLNLVAANALVDPNTSTMAKSIFSCLLYSAVEAKEYWRALKYFRQLEKTTQGPSEKDCANLFRALVVREDWTSIVAVLIRTPLDRAPRAIGSVTQTLVENARPDSLSHVVREATCPQVAFLVLQEMKKSHFKGNVLSAVLGRSSVTDQILVNAASLAAQWELDDKTIESTVADLLQRPDARASSILLINSLLRRVSEPKNVFNSLVALLRNSLFVDSAVKPDMATYMALLKLSPSVNQTMEVYRMFREQKGMNSRLKADEQFVNGVLVSIASRTFARNNTSAVVAFGIVHDFIAEDFRPSIRTVSILVSILTKAGTEESFRQTLELLTKTCQTEYGLVPEQTLFAPAIAAAIRMRRDQWVSRLFQAMAEVGRGKSKASSDLIDGLLLEALKAENESGFCLLVELALLHRLPVRESTVARLRECAKLQSVLVKYKYKLS